MQKSYKIDQQSDSLLDSPPTGLPFHQLNSDEIAPIPAVKQNESVRRGGLELKEQVHGRVGLQGGQAQVTALGFEGHGVSDDGAHAEARVELAVIDVAVLAQVDVEHAVKLEALQVTDEAGGDHGDEAALRHHARLDVVEL